jgi:hypothetical protein
MLKYHFLIQQNLNYMSNVRELFEALDFPLMICAFGQGNMKRQIFTYKSSPIASELIHQKLFYDYLFLDY